MSDINKDIEEGFKEKIQIEVSTSILISMNIMFMGSRIG
jgi:hypothetical protein